ncbi:MAG: ribosome maturation factor RimP [Ilumatobacteraceae bacterium]
MKSTPDDGPAVTRVRTLVAPIASDLGLEVYDVEQRGGTLRVTLDTPAGSSDGVDLDTLALATRLVSRELDHDDPMPGHYTLEVTSPGLERTLRTPAHFQREVGKTLNVRLADVASDQRRLEGMLVAAGATSATLRVTDADSGAAVDREVAYDQIDRARTVFEWGPQPKPGGSKQGNRKRAATSSGRAKNKKNKEKQSS